MNTPFEADAKSEKKTPAKKPEAFTLIELLVVIAIIAVLAGIMLAAINSSLASAKRVTAKNLAVNIATAIAGYESEYGRLPSNGTSTNFDTALVTMLCTSNDAVNNPRGIIFLDASVWKNGKGGTNANGFCDPFNANHPFSIALDTSYVNMLSNMPAQTNLGGTIYSTNITKHIGVWTVWTNSGRTYLIDSWD